MGKWDGLDRRKFPRVNYPCLVIIRHEQNGEDDVILTHTENVGIGGVCVILKKNIDMFTAVEIELDLLDLGNHIRCRGKIVWNVRRKIDDKKKPLFYDVGVEFQDINKKDQERVDEVVKKLVKANRETPYIR